MSQQGKDNGIVIPPRCETMGKARIHTVNTGRSNLSSRTLSPGLLAVNRGAAGPNNMTNYQPSNYQQSNYQQSNYQQSNYQQSNYQQSNYQQSNYQQSNYQQSNYQQSNYLTSNYPTSNYPTSNYPTSNYPQSNYPTSSYNYQPNGPQAQRPQTVRSRGLSNVSNVSSSNGSSTSGFYPVIPSRDISRNKTASLNSPPKPVGSFYRPPMPENYVSNLNRSNTVANGNAFARGHTPKNSINSITSIVSEGTNRIVDETALFSRGYNRGPLTSPQYGPYGPSSLSPNGSNGPNGTNVLNGLNGPNRNSQNGPIVSPQNTPNGKIEPIENNNDGVCPPTPPQFMVNTAKLYGHSRSQSYGSLNQSTKKAVERIRSNSSGNTSSINPLRNSRQTKSEDNVISKGDVSYQSSSLTSNPPVVADDSNFNPPAEVSTPSQVMTDSPSLLISICNELPGLGTNEVPQVNKSEVVFPPRKNGNRTRSVYSSYSSSSMGEYMEYSGIQNIDSTFLSQTIREDDRPPLSPLSSNSVLSPLSSNAPLSPLSTHMTIPVQNTLAAPSTSPTSVLSSSSQVSQSVVIPTRTSASKRPRAKTAESSQSAISNSNVDTSKNTISPANENSATNISVANVDISKTISNENVNETEEEEAEEAAVINHSALLSEIAEEFISALPLTKLEKDSIEYTDCFTGADAVTTIANVLGTKKRKLALAIGRSLESQSLFHDVLYTSILEDSKDHIYQMPYRNIAVNRDSNLDFSNILNDYIENEVSIFSENDDIAKRLTLGPNMIHEKEEEATVHTHTDLPCGVFVAISSCYSMTCTEDSPCYSYTCPRRMAYNLKSSSTKADLGGDSAWSTTVSKNILEKVDKNERKRQEIIFEFIQTEKEYVDDLRSVVQLIRKPLEEGVIPKIDQKFVDIVFNNMEEILDINSVFSNMLQNLQKQNSIVDRLGDVTQEYVKNFTCYIKYGEIQPLAKEVLQYHRGSNRLLEAFLKEMQSKKEFRRLPLESFLARPTTRLGRYPILIRDILKHTKEDHPDQISLNATVETIKDILKQVNEKAGKTINKIKLDQWTKSLDQSTLEKIEDVSVLRLSSVKRNFIREGTLQMKRENATPQEVDIVLLDNALVITRKKVNSIEIIRKPIPIHLLKVVDHSEQDKINNQHVAFNEKSYSFSVLHLGFRTYTFTTKVYSEQKSWVETLEETVKEAQKSCIDLFNIYSSKLKFSNAVIVKDDIMIFVNENGLYTNLGNALTMILPLKSITSIEIMPEAGLLFVLIDKEVIPYSIDSLLKGDLVNNTKKPRKLCSGISFMKIGYCDGHRLLCAVKTANSNSTVRSYEPNQRLIDAISAKTTTRKVSTLDVLIPHKQLYIPSEVKSLHFLKRNLCVGCTKGYEVLNMDTLTTESLFDIRDPNYEWIIKALYNPVELIKTAKGDFLVCYNKVGFFLDKNGNPSRNNMRFFWMHPINSFAYISPYIIAISDDYIEVWNENDSDKVEQIIFGPSVKLLKSHNDDGVYIISGSGVNIISRVLLSRKRTL